MDVFAHFLWTYALFSKQKYALLAALFGLLPDLLVFIPFMVSRIFQGTFQFGKPELSIIPTWVFQLYNITHSLVIFSVVFAAAWWWFGSPQWYLLGWSIHILIDIPTHNSSFFPTPFLYPLSDYTFAGIQWSEKWFMVANYGSLAVIYLLMFLRKL